MKNKINIPNFRAQAYRLAYIQNPEQRAKETQEALQANYEAGKLAGIKEKQQNKK